MAFNNYFRKGSVGRDLFEKPGIGIRAFLTVEDFECCSEAHGTGLSNGLCKLYSHLDIIHTLEGKYQNRPEHEIDTMLWLKVDEGTIQQLLLESDDFNFRSTDSSLIFHSEVLPVIYWIITTWLRACGNLVPFSVNFERMYGDTQRMGVPGEMRGIDGLYVLLEATLCDRTRARDGENWSVDVTKDIKKLVDSHSGCLVLDVRLAFPDAWLYYCAYFVDILSKVYK